MKIKIIHSSAEFSPCRKYRYTLKRVWDESKPMVQFIGLNPSTANENENDATVRRCINFAASWGYGGMFMTNIFSYVSTNPDDLKTSGENTNKNDAALIETAAQCTLVVFAWGASFKQHQERMNEVKKMFPGASCIKISKTGEPCHPLYLKGDLKPIRYNLNTDYSE